jgi:probable F420-dependent oxidoreductase
MLVDGPLGFGDPSQIAASARDGEADGYDGLWAAETSHDPFLPLAIGAEHTEGVELGTAIAVAFARNPMTTAELANDLQLLSKGRFILGLGTQIRPHIERRFSMPWSHPAPRVREFVLALRAIWHAWNAREKLDFRGRFYTHTLMTPFFDPGPNPYGPPKVFLAAVGEHMAEVAGEVADGLLVHPFTTARYLREVTVPALERGLARGGRSREGAGFQVSYPGFVVTGDSEEEREAARSLVRSQIAFYGSTPAYRPVLELHGWGELQPQLNALSKQGEWAKMGDLVTDEMLDAFAVIAPLDEVPARVGERFGDLVDRFSFYAPPSLDRARWREVLAGFHRA